MINCVTGGIPQFVVAKDYNILGIIEATCGRRPLQFVLAIGHNLYEIIITRKSANPVCIIHIHVNRCLLESFDSSHDH